jgi:hypothetical protein
MRRNCRRRDEPSAERRLLILNHLPDCPAQGANMTDTKQPNAQPTNPKDAGKQQGQQKQNQQPPQHQGSQKQP